MVLLQVIVRIVNKLNVLFGIVTFVIILKDCVKIFVICLQRENKLKCEAKNDQKIGCNRATWAVPLDLLATWHFAFGKNSVKITKAKEKLDHIN